MGVFDRFPKPPGAETLGWELLAEDAAAGTIPVAFEGRREFCNPAGAIQGGFLAAMLDDTLGPAVVVASGGECYPATIDLHVHFLAPARPGRLVGTGRVVRMGGTIAFLEGELADPDGTVVAKASASARVVPIARLPDV